MNSPSTHEQKPRDPNEPVAASTVEAATSKDPLGTRLGRLLLGPPEMMAAAPVTRAVILSTLVVFVAQVLAVRRTEALITMPERAMLLFGANYSPFVWGEHRVEVLLTSVFLHASLLHIAFNLYALRQVGPFVERVGGSARFSLLYIVSGVLGSLVSAAQPFFVPGERLSAGASGAICGLIGAALVIGIRTQGWTGPIAKSMGFWLFLTVAVGSKMNADNAAHLGGAVVGALMAAFWKRGQLYTPRTTAVIVGVCGALVALAFAAVAGRDLADPYASLSSMERREVAVGSILAGQCDESKAAVAAAARVKAPKLEPLNAEITRMCPP